MQEHGAALRQSEPTAKLQAAEECVPLAEPEEGVPSLGWSIFRSKMLARGSQTQNCHFR